MNDAAPRMPDFFIVGAPRCGTTALYTYLRQHPQVCLPDYKEPHFFNIDMDSGGAIRDKTQYLELFHTGKDKKRVGEASVYYLSSKEAPAGIKRLCPDAKIIIMLRNPVDVIHAIHAVNVAGWVEDVWDLEQALSLEQARKQGRSLPPWLKDVAKVHYRDTVRFSQQVKTYVDLFGRAGVHVIIYDDFKNDPGRAFRDACTFLDLSRDVRTAFPVVWSNVAFRSQTLSRFLQRPPGLVRHLGRLLLPHGFRAKIVDTVWTWNSARAPRQPMSAALRERLTAELAPEVKELGILLGRDLSHWSPCQGTGARSQAGAA